MVGYTCYSSQQEAAAPSLPGAIPGNQGPQTKTITRTASALGELRAPGSRPQVDHGPGSRSFRNPRRPAGFAPGSCAARPRSTGAVRPPGRGLGWQAVKHKWPQRHKASGQTWAGGQLGRLHLPNRKTKTDEKGYCCCQS